METVNIIKYLSSGLRKKFPCIHYVDCVNLVYAPYTFHKTIKITLKSSIRFHITYEYELMSYISTLLEFTSEIVYSDCEIKLTIIF